jgi:hypothetical protein
MPRKKKKLSEAERAQPPPPGLGTHIPDVPIDQTPPPPDEASLRDRKRIRDLSVELARRQIEALKIYTALPVLERFHQSNARMRVIRGSNRAGKTLGAAVEIARAVTGQDPFHKYPVDNGRAYLVAKDGKEIGQVMYRKLFRADAFKIIRDRKFPHRWRPWCPWIQDDIMRSLLGRYPFHDQSREVFPAPPLIPPRFIKNIAWELKGASIPNIITLHNGWELSFFTSNAKPPHGADIDLAWFDEEIVDPDWLPEMTARLVDRRGRHIWSATPQAGTDQLYQLHETAEEEATKERPIVEEYVTYLSENPFLTAEAKEEFIRQLPSDEERRVRVGGEFALTSYRVYADFNITVHGVEPFPIPPDWCRYMIVDPGWQVCGVLFAALPPPMLEDAVYLYDELYLQGCTAERFADAVAVKAIGQTFHAFIMDLHGGISRDIGSGLTREVQYAHALKAKNVQSTVTGSSFLWGIDDIRAGVLAVHSWLRPREDGRPKLRVLKSKLMQFEREIKFYHHRRRPDGTVTDEIIQKYNHLMDCLRYLASHDPKWYAPPKQKKRDSWALEMLKAKRARARQREGETYIHLGPGKEAPQPT